MQNYLVPKICTSTNYNEFHFLPSNRPALHWAKIAESVKIRNLLAYVPILVILIDGVKYIIDGQNRFMAARSLFLPVYYLIVENGLEDDMKILNLETVNWTLADFLHFYASKNIEGYVNLQKCLDSCGNLTVGHAIHIWQSRKNEYRTTNEAFRGGGYIFDSDAANKMREVSRILRAIENKGITIVNKTSLVSAISSLVGADMFEIDRMLGQIDKFCPNIWDNQANQDAYRDHLDLIYNHMQRQGKKVSFKYLKRNISQPPSSKDGELGDIAVAA